MNVAVPKITAYDNPNTILYKYAKFYNQPASYLVIVKNPETGEKKYEIMDDYVRRELVSGNNLLTIYNSLKIDNAKIDIDMLKRSVIVVSGVLSGEISSELTSAILANFRELDNYLSIPSISPNPDIKDLEVMLNDANKKYIFDLTMDTKRGEDIENMQRDFITTKESNPFLLKTPVNINSAVFMFKPKLVGRTDDISSRFGFYIYDSIVLSQHVPYAQYNTIDGNQYPKIYKSDRLDAEPRYNNIASPKDQSQRSNVIYLTLWLGNPDDDFFTAAKETFHIVTLSLETGQLSVNIPFNIRGTQTENERLSAERIQAAIPTLILGEKDEVKVRADTRFIPIYRPYQVGAQLRVPASDVPVRILETGISYPNVQFEMIEYLFLHLCLLNKSFSPNIYSEESMKPFPLKKRMELHYRPAYSDIAEATTPVIENYISNSATLSFTLSVRRTGIGESIEIESGDGTTNISSLQDGYNYIHINITKAESRDVVFEFLRIIEPILLIYWDYQMNKREDILGVYNYLVPENEIMRDIKRGVKLTKESQRSLTRVGKLRGSTSELQENFPEVFGGRYSIRCQGKQPLAIRSIEEAEAWTNQTFSHAGEVKKRQYIPFPPAPQETMFYVVCPNDLYPYPGVKRNNTGHNEDKYPFVPCCFASDQIAKKQSKYNQYYKGAAKPSKEKTQERLKRNALLEPGRIGALPPSIEQLLKQYSDDVGQINRLGVPRSHSSFLHAVLYAVQDVDYLMRTTAAAKEEYVRKMRKYIAETIRPEVMKQELYDMTDESIRKELINPEIPMDPNLFYRALEELYEINIFTFGIEGKSNEDPGMILIPRNKYFHTRPQRFHRKTVIIYKHMGSEVTGLKFHQCDLVIDRKKSKKKGTKESYFYIEEDEDTIIFDVSMTEICSNALEAAMNTITWMMPSLDAYYNMYNIVDFGSMINNTAISQYVDSNGKARAFTFPYRGYNVCMMTIPTQPLNVPHSNLFPSAPLEIALSLFQEPTAIIRGTGRLSQSIIGIWFKIVGVEHGIYVRVDVTNTVPSLIESTLRLPEGPPDPLGTENKSMVERLGFLRKQLSFVLQFVKWVFDVGRMILQSQGINEDKEYAKRFFEVLVTSDAGGMSADIIYDFSNIPNNLLPNVRTIEEATEYISRTVPLMIKKENGIDKIVMYSEDFRKKMESEMEVYLMNTLGQNIIIPNELNSFYVTYKDFTQQSHVEIFTSIEDLEYWIESRISTADTRFIIHTKLDLNMSITIDPYIYKDLKGKIHIIQNTVDGTIGSAARIARTWKIDKVNMGSEIKPLREKDLPNRIIYGISSDGNLIPIYDNTQGSKDYVSVIFYGTNENWASGQGGRYGAILDM